MKRQPNLFARAAVLSLLVAAAITFRDVVTKHLPLDTPEAMGSLLGRYVADVIAAFIPIGVLVLLWSFISTRLLKRGN